MELSWAWRRWYLNINQLCWAPLPSRTFIMGIFQSDLLRHQSLPSWSPGLWACFSLSSLSPISWTPQSHVHAAKLPLMFTSPTSVSFWWVWSPTEHFSLAPQSFGGGICNQCCSRSFGILNALLCWPSNRYQMVDQDQGLWMWCCSYIFASSFCSFWSYGL